MGMTPQEYDTILYRDLVPKLEGFKERLEYGETINRKVAYSSYIGPHLNPKRIPEIDKFWPIGDSKNKKGKNQVSLAEKRAAIAEYFKAQNNSNG